MRRTEKAELLDALTGIYSRASLRNRLQEEVDRSNRYGQPFSILLLDLDHFKSVNDAFGHRRGDDVLITLANRLRMHIRKSDLVFRYGGDEFILLLPGTEKDDAVELAGRLIRNLGDEPYEGSPPLKLTCSMGLASYPADAASPEGLFDAADKRHYHAKRSGRNQIVSDDPDLQDGLQFEKSLRVIDREPALDRVYAFFDALSEARQGTLAITGPAGVGKSRFLEEVAKIARLHGHLILPVSGKRSLKSRALGALLEAGKDWEGLPSVSAGESVFLRGLNQLLEDKGNQGVVFVVDNLGELDRQSIATLERIAFNPALAHVAVAYSVGEDAARPMFPESPLNEIVALKPLSESGVQIWLRHVLQWEAPPEFTGWLHENTGGLPERLRLSLYLLAQEGHLVKNRNWSLDPSAKPGDFRNYPLAYRLAQEVNRPRSNLPAELSTFVGRTAELARLKKLLLTNRLVSLVGPGGIGKSRLALQVAVELEDYFTDGVFHVEMEELDPTRLEAGAARLYTAITGSLDLALNDKAEVRTQLLEHLAGRRLLLFLNNYDHMAAANAALEELLSRAPGLTVLLTSREVTGVKGETAFALGGLPLPEEEHTPGAQHYEAVQLFLAHAQRVEPDFALTDKNMSAVIKICRLVGGMPLGIELAAAWVSMFSPEELADEIERNYQFLSAADRDGDGQSVQAVFDYFWGLLSTHEQRILARLAVFQREFDTQAAAQVAGASPFFLGALTNRVFLVKAADGRYRMHDLLRLYAESKLEAEPDEARAARLDHSRYYLGFLQHHTPHLRGERQKESQMAIASAAGNIRVAWVWALQNRAFDLLDAAVEPLYLFYDNQGRYRDGDAIFSLAVQMLEQSTSPAERQRKDIRRVFQRLKLRTAIFRAYLGFIRQSKEQIEECLGSVLEGNDPAELALCYEHLGWTYYDLAQPRQEIKLLWNKSLSLYRAHNIPTGIARLLYNLSFISPLEENRELMQEKLAICTAIGDQIGIADALLSLGGILDQLGETETARANLHRSLDIYEQLGHLDGIAFSHFGLADLHLNQGQYEEAKAGFEKALHFFRQAGNVNGMSTSLSRLCRVAIAQGDYARARDGLEDSLALERQSGSQIGMAYALNFLGELSLAERNAAAARRYLEESLSILSEAQDEWGLGRAFHNLARLSLLEGDPQTALEHAEQGLQIALSMGETTFIQGNYLAAGAAARALNDLAAARKYLRSALEQAHRRRSPPLILETLLEIGHLLDAAGRAAQAESIFGLVLAHPTAARGTRELAMARGSVAQPEMPLPPGALDLLTVSVLEGELHD